MKRGIWGMKCIFVEGKTSEITSGKVIKIVHTYTYTQRVSEEKAECDAGGGGVIVRHSDGKAP